MKKIGADDNFLYDKESLAKIQDSYANTVMAGMRENTHGDWLWRA